MLKKAALGLYKVSEPGRKERSLGDLSNQIACSVTQQPEETYSFQQELQMQIRDVIFGFSLPGETWLKQSNVYTPEEVF